MSNDFEKNELPDWLQGDNDDESFEPALPPADDDDSADETPDWLARLGNLTPNRPAAPEEPPATADLPNWLFENDDEPPTGETELPSWLADMDAPKTSALPAASEPSLGELPSDDFLSLGDALPATSDLEMSYQQWQAEQDILRNGPDLEAEMPDLFAGIDDQPADVKSTGELPDWYLGLEELDQSDVPDWMLDDAPAKPARTITDDTPSWMAGLEPTSPADAPAPVSGDFDDDFFAALGVANTTETPSEAPVDLSWLDDDTLTTATERTRDDAKEDDFFEALTASLPDQPTALEPLEDDEPLAAEDSDDDMSWLADVMPQASQSVPAREANLDDLFAGLDDAEAQTASNDFEIDWGSEPEPAPAKPTPAAAKVPQPKEFDFGDDDDPFLNFDAPRRPRTVDMNAEPDWLDDLDGSTLLDAETRPQETGPLLPDIERPTLPTTGELEQFLAGLDGDAIRLPQTSQLADQSDFDFEASFGEDIRLPERSPVQTDNLAPAMPDFLDQLGANVGEISAGAIVRQRKDKPLETLDDRLKDLHNRGEKLRTSETPVADAELLKRVLPNVPEPLAAAPIAAGQPSIPQALALTAAERERISLLQNLVRRDATTEDADALPATDNKKRRKPKPAAKARPTGKRRRYNFDRLVIAAALAAAVAAPFFVDDLRIGSLPPATFSAGGPGALAFERVEALRPRTPVLVAIEYGPTSAAELDPMLDALVRHLFMSGAHPVLVGGNPVGLAHAANVVEAIANDEAFRERAGLRNLRSGQEYTVVRYLAGDLVGLRALAENTADFMLTDIRGQATRLNIDSLRDFGLITVITDNSEDVRNYAEQIAPIAGAPVVLATSYSAGPIARAYTGTESVLGLLVGYGDAYTYAVMIGEPVAIDATVPLVVPPETTPEATAQTPRSSGAGLAVPPALATFQARFIDGFNAAGDVTEEATVEGITDATATEPPTDAPEASATPQPPTTAAGVAAQSTATTAPTQTHTATATLTVTPSDTPTATPTQTATPTNTPTLTPTATPTATATPTLTPSRTPTRTPQPAGAPTAEVVTGRIASSQDAVNVRSGPGTGFGVSNTVASGAQVDVIGVNANRTWYRIRLPNSDAEGWVAIQLVYIAEGADRVPVVETEGAYKPQPYLRVLAQATEEPTSEATPDATEESTEEAAATATPAPSATPLVIVEGSSPYAPLTPVETRDERWYATTLGIIASSTIIALGAAVNIARAVARRRSR
jgi:hypothetical protein